MLKKTINSLKNTKTEVKKITWPSKKETRNYTISILAISAFFSVFILAVDFLITRVMQIALT